MLTAPSSHRHDLQPLVHLLTELQDAQSVSALRHFVPHPHRSEDEGVNARSCQDR